VTDRIEVKVAESETIIGRKQAVSAGNFICKPSIGNKCEGIFDIEAPYNGWYVTTPKSMMGLQSAAGGEIIISAGGTVPELFFDCKLQ
jgi:hypothetical protein